MECDNNRLDGMCHLRVIQLNLVFIMFRFYATWMSQVQGFRRPKLLTRKMSVLSILFWSVREDVFAFQARFETAGYFAFLKS